MEGSISMDTPTEGLDSSLAQRLMSRHMRTHLPSKDLLLQPQVVQNVVTKKHRKGLISKHHYDAHTHDMPVIIQEETVRVLLKPNVPNSA